MIGSRVMRREDLRLLTGRGRYLADHDVAGLCHVAIVRSTFAHAVVRSISTAAASGLAGVVAVVTQADLERAGARPMGHMLQIPGIKSLSWGVLASDRVRFVGEPVVAIVADSRAIAEDACELVEVDYEELPAVVGVERGLADGAPLLYPEWGTNEFLHLSASSPGFDQRMEGAPHRVVLTLEHHRVTAVPLEGHGAQASVDSATGMVTVIASNQQPHQLRSVIAETCGLSESDVRVISPDMGGGFGNKQHFTREECLVALLARMTGRPVRWSQDRSEGLTASVHSRPQLHRVEAGFDDSGRVLALRVRILSDVGNPVLYFSGIGPSLVTVASLSGCGYDIPSFAWDLSCVATTTCPVGAYRGFGQPQAHFTTERVMDAVASTLGLDPAEVRRRNLLPDAPRPWIGHGGERIDVGPLGQHLDELLASFDYGGWRDRQTKLRAAGRLVGIGLSTLVQGTAPNQYGVAGRFGSWEMATVSVLPDGRVVVAVGTKSQGQGHETVLAQVAASALGVGVERLVVQDGDTALLPGGMGTWGSRSAVMGGGAVLQAARAVRDKMDRIKGGRSMSFDEIAVEAWWHTHRLVDEAPGLSETVCYTPGHTRPVPDEQGQANFDETYGAHMAAVAVEVMPATGAVRVLDAVLVSDCGVIINPMVVEGQHQGGFAQGLGAVLLEEFRYSPEGQPLSATLLDYTIPGFPEVPTLRIVHRSTPAEGTAGGFRGVGEAAIIVTPAMVAGAVADALAPVGVSITSTRLHAGEIRRLMRATGYTADPAAFARG